MDSTVEPDDRPVTLEDSLRRLHTLAGALGVEVDRDAYNSVARQLTSMLGLAGTRYFDA